MINNSLSYWLAAVHCKNISPRIFINLIKQFSSIEGVFQASKDDLQQSNLTHEQINGILSPNWKEVEKDLIWVEHSSHHLISLDEKIYPPLLKEISDPPLILYLHGKQKAILMPQMAIVGSRHATTTGIKTAETFARVLVEAGFAITSGLALGIDAASHEGALAKSGITIAVLGAGLHHIYPRSHRALAEKIIENEGALVSEFPLNVPPMAMNFPRRNRIIAGLCFGVLVVEAAIKSGSLITARHALEAGREVFAIPGSIHNPLTRGCHYLIRQGAKLVENSTDILEELAHYKIISPNPEKKSNIAALLPEREQEVFNLIEYEVTSIDMLISRTGLTASEVSSILLSLELNGYVDSVQGGFIRNSK